MQATTRTLKNITETQFCLVTHLRAGLEQKARLYAHSCWCGLAKDSGVGGIPVEGAACFEPPQKGLEVSSQLLLTVTTRKSLQRQGKGNSGL